MRRKKREVEKHHRLPRSRGGADNYPNGNISIIDKEIHRAWHKVVGNMTASEVAKMLTDTYIDPRYYLVAIPRKRKQSKERRERRYCVDCQAEVLKHIRKTCKGDCDGEMEGGG